MSEQAIQTEKRCRMEGCKRPYRAKSYCNVHYRAWRQGKLGKARYKICSEEECLGRREAMGLCKTHLEEWRAARGKGTASAEEKSGAEAEAAEKSADAEVAGETAKESVEAPAAEATGEMAKEPAEAPAQESKEEKSES